MKLKDIGVVAALMLGATMVTVALFASFYLGVRFGEGTPAGAPPHQGIERHSVTLKVLSSGDWVEVQVFDTGKGKIFVSSVRVHAPEDYLD